MLPLGKPSNFKKVEVSFTLTFKIYVTDVLCQGNKVVLSN